MSIITANTLFHFTSQKDVLLSILRGGFRPSYCDEFGSSLGGAIISMKIPMVCFCDLPISKLDKHINGYEWDYEGEKRNNKGYGKYGLGMSKSWGKAKRFNPVTYVNPESFLLESAGNTVNALFDLYTAYQSQYNSAINSRAQVSGDYIDPSNSKDQINHQEITGSMILDIYAKLDHALFCVSNAVAAFSYMKPYQDAKTGQLYYDEREWRFTIPYTRQYKGDVPVLRVTLEGNYVPLFSPNSEKDLEYYKELIQKDYMLKFEASDVKYIIVENDKDIDDVIECLNNLKTEGIYTESDVNRLYTRIITTEQIRDDL